MKVAQEFVASDWATSEKIQDIDLGYDPDKLNLALEFYKVQDTPDGSRKMIGPAPTAILRPNEMNVPVPSVVVHALRWNANIDLVFLGDGLTATTNRRFVLAWFDRRTFQFSWKGVITATHPQGTNATIRGFRAVLYRYRKGTVSVTGGTTLTGSGTEWAQAGISVGSRIALNVTGDPDENTEWYEINGTAATFTDTAATLSSAAPNVTNVPYIIEELRLVYSHLNSGTNTGGLLLIKGLHSGVFSPANPNIATPGTSDRIRGTYWLKDASTNTNNASNGLALEPFDDTDTSLANWQSHNVYVGDGASTSMTFFKYNIRAALTVASGNSVNAFLFKTGAAAVVGTISVNNNGRYAVLNHGSGSGVPSIYFVTTTRLYRVPVSAIQTGSTAFIAAGDSSVEIPPGGVNTTPASGALNTIEHSGTMDRLIVIPTGAAASRPYLTTYKTDSSAWDRQFMSPYALSQQSAADSNVPPIPCTNNNQLQMWGEAGILYILRNAGTGSGNTAFVNMLWAIPMAADYVFAPAPRCILPRILTPNAKRFFNVYANFVSHVGGNEPLTYPREPTLLWYRTQGIEDNSGAWTQLDPSGRMSAVAMADEIQFRCSFRLIGPHMVPSCLTNLTVVYDDNEGLPAEFKWTGQDTNDSAGVAGFKQTSIVVGGITRFTIIYKNESDGTTVLTQNSDGTVNGTFQWLDGSTWTSGIGPNVVGTRRRFNPAVVPPVPCDVALTVE